MLLYTTVPVFAATLAALLAAYRRPGPVLVSALQHFTAGVVFAAAAGELLPDLKHRGLLAVIVGAVAGIFTVLLVGRLERVVKGPLGLFTTVGIDVLIDGLVLGLGFDAGRKEGFLLLIALSLETLFLGLTVTAELGERAWSPAKMIGATTALALLIPLGAALASPISLLPPAIVTGFFAFGLMALLYLVTEELLVDAHKEPDRPWVTAMFFTGFLLLLCLEDLVG